MLDLPSVSAKRKFSAFHLMAYKKCCSSLRPLPISCFTILPQVPTVSTGRLRVNC